MKQKKGLRVIGVLALLAVAALVVLPATASSLSQASNTQNVLVERGSISEKVQAVGKIKVEPSALLTWKSGGIVKTNTLKVGDKVAKGNVLLTLEDNSKSGEILQSQSGLLETQAKLDKLLAADTNFQDALREFTYQEEILKNKYSQRHEFYSTEVSDERVDAVRASYIQTRQEVWGLEAAFESVRKLDENNTQRVAVFEALQTGILKRDSLLRAFNQILGYPYGHRVESYFYEYDQQVAVVAEARAAYNRYIDKSEEISAARANVQSLQNTIDQTSIIAPFSGTITTIKSVAGEQVMPGDTALQLDDLSNFSVDLEISQMDVNKILLGQSAEFAFNAIPNRKYSGTVMEISKAGSDNGDDIVFKVRVALDDADELVKPGFTATVSITTNQIAETLLIPNTAIRYEEDGTPFVLKDIGLNKTTQIPVEIGIHTDVFSELKGGDLMEGDRLVLYQDNGQSFRAGSGEFMFAIHRIRK